MQQPAATAPPATVPAKIPMKMPATIAVKMNINTAHVTPPAQVNGVSATTVSSATKRPREGVVSDVSPRLVDGAKVTRGRARASSASSSSSSASLTSSSSSSSSRSSSSDTSTSSSELSSSTSSTTSRSASVRSNEADAAQLGSTQASTQPSAPQTNETATNEASAPPAVPPRPRVFRRFPADLDKEIEKFARQLKVEECLIRTKDDTKAVSLGTSKTNYIDPRIVCSWATAQNVPIEKVLSKTLLSKFPWALNATNFTF